jgi:hypothetical protein
MNGRKMMLLVTNGKRKENFVSHFKIRFSRCFLILGIGHFFKIGIMGVESNWVHSALRPAIGLLCPPRVIMWRNWWNDDWQGKPKYSEKTCPSAALSATKTTCRPDANLGRRGGKPATNRLSYGTAINWPLSRGFRSKISYVLLLYTTWEYF